MVKTRQRRVIRNRSYDGSSLDKKFFNPVGKIQLMAITTVAFQSAEEFTKFIDQEIVQMKKTLGVHMKQVEEIRQRYEKLKKRYDTIKRLMEGKKEADDLNPETKQLEVAGFKVLMNPTAEYELSLMENVVSSLQEKLNAFERSKELLPLLSAEERLTVTMVLDDGIPTGFMVYVEKN